MGIYNIDSGYRKGANRLRRSGLVLFSVLIAISGYALYTNPKSTTEISRPVEALATAPKPKLLTDPLPWPNYGQASYGVVGDGVLADSDDGSKPVPVASLAKVITALAILKQKPLNQGEQGPLITLTEQDVALYEEYVRKSGAVVPIEPGERISQYQALQAMLMSSANNMADTLVTWAFGSIEAYNRYANTMVNEYGLSATSIADASGFSPLTTSTAHDMTEAGMRYMQNPVLKEIALQPEATIPFAGKIQNYNSVQNQNGVTGIKVGNTDEAGRCFMVADIREGTTAVSVILGADTLDQAIKQSKSILTAGNSSYDKQALQ